MARWLAGSASDARTSCRRRACAPTEALEDFGGDNPRAWVMKIVRNTAFTWLNKHRDLALVSMEKFEEHGEGQSLDVMDPRDGRNRR